MFKNQRIEMAKVTCLAAGVDVDQKPTRIQTEKGLVSAVPVMSSRCLPT